MKDDRSDFESQEPAETDESERLVPQYSEENDGDDPPYDGSGSKTGGFPIGSLAGATPSSDGNDPPDDGSGSKTGGYQVQSGAEATPRGDGNDPPDDGSGSKTGGYPVESTDSIPPSEAPYASGERKHDGPIVMVKVQYTTVVNKRPITVQIVP